MNPLTRNSQTLTRLTTASRRRPKKRAAADDEGWAVKGDLPTLDFEGAMGLPDTYESIRPSIVALGSRLSVTRQGQPRPFPTIVGTGFFVDDRGILATNKHVAEYLEQLPRHPKTGEHPAFAIIAGRPESAKGEHHLRLLFVDVKGYSIPHSFTKKGPSYAEPIPDLAFLQLKVRDVPALHFAADLNTLQIGMPVATAGFPLGEEALVLFEKVVQITPFLRQGIISSLHPFPCPSPDGFTIDILMQGGGSGSPIFLIDAPLIVGMLYASFPNANITLAVPSTMISAALEACLRAATLDLTDVPTLESLFIGSDDDTNPKWDQIAL